MTLSYGDAALYPGSGGPGAPGRSSRSARWRSHRSTGGLPLTYVAPSTPASLCGKRWDWIEALGA